MPLIGVITTFSFCAAGMMFMPGVDAEGNPYRLNIFDAFYQMTITLTTVGLPEAPYPSVTRSGCGCRCRSSCW